MITNLSRIKFFFFLILCVPLKITALDFPNPEPRPEIKKREYQDVFNQIKKQNWVMALALAKDYNNPSLSSYVKWLDITRPGSNHDFDYLIDFFKNHANWPKKKIIIEKIESSITKDHSSKKIIEWFNKMPPMTAKGNIDFFEFRMRENYNLDKAKEIKEIWIKQNLTGKQQRYFIKNYSKYWGNDDNWKRFSRLLSEGKNVSARKTLNRIFGDHRKLGEAQFALSRRSPNVSSLIKKVPQSLINNPVLIYERMRWRRKAKLESAVEFLYDPPDKIYNVRNWWINARVVIRRLINKKRYDDAYKILNNHKLPLTEESGREAEWLAGWVAFHHLKKPLNGLNHFKKLYNNSEDINVKSKAAFWISLANKSLKNKKEELKWLKISSKNKFSYYGQNASIKLGSMNFLKEKKSFIKPKDSENLLKVIDIIINSEQNTEKTLVFYQKLLDISESDSNRYYVLNEANKLKNKYILTLLSKKLRGPSVIFSYPLIENYIPAKFKNSFPTLALIHAISHQESNFRINAYSHAGARGVMQLMPFTARKVAKDLRIKYYKKQLTRNPQYNIILGTTYINQMLRRFKNSLPLSLAAYNAGPSRVRIWLKRYGDPRLGKISYINWIESIPLEETRYYVKKVLSNLRVYQKKYKIEIYEASLDNKKI